MFIFSWNVDGLNVEKWDKLKSYIALQCPEVVCLNEIKGKAERISKFFEEYKTTYDYLINSHKPANMHGVAILIRKDIKWEQININLDCPSRSETRDPDPTCGRIMAIKFWLSENISFILVLTYVPNSGVDWKNPLKNLDYRIDMWDKSLFHALNLMKEKYERVIWMGDINVAPEEIDVSHPTALRRKAGFTSEERESLRQFLENCDWLDIWRQQHPGIREYTFKGYTGYKYRLRLDNCIITQNLESLVLNSIIFPDKEFMESDHNPIGIQLSDDTQKKIKKRIVIKFKKI